MAGLNATGYRATGGGPTVGARREFGGRGLAGLNATGYRTTGGMQGWGGGHLPISSFIMDMSASRNVTGASHAPCPAALASGRQMRMP